jgi:hypothetical protein
LPDLYLCYQVLNLVCHYIFQIKRQISTSLQSPFWGHRNCIFKFLNYFITFNSLLWNWVIFDIKEYFTVWSPELYFFVRFPWFFPKSANTAIYMFPFYRFNAYFSYKLEPYRTNTLTVFHDFNNKDLILIEKREPYRNLFFDDRGTICAFGINQHAKTILISNTVRFALLTFLPERWILSV